MNKLEKYIKNRCISQRGWAKKIGVTPNTFGLYVKGKNIPPIRVAYMIEKLTGGHVTIYDWVPEEDKKITFENDFE